MLKRNFNIVKKSIFAVLVFIFIVFTIGIIPSIDPNNKNKVILSAASWKTDLAEITEVTDISSKDYVDILSLVTTDENGLVTAVANPSTLIQSNTLITISDGLELYYFTEICNEVLADGTTKNDYYDEYLTYNYILTNDINYEDASKTFKMLRPIGHKKNVPFSGTFDGQGFTISNIFIRPFEDENEALIYGDMVSLSWFSQNSGTISNIGIINPNMIQYDIYDGVLYATPFIGVNEGTVENCYVQDLRGNTAGLSAEGGYYISMFAATNAGTIKNCYVATNRIYSSQVSITKQEQRHPFIFSNSGTINNCYFDSQIILGTYDTMTYDGLTGITTADFTNGTFDEADVYHSNYTYTHYTENSEYSQYLNLKYPVLHGFNIDEDKYFLIEDVNDFVYMFNLINQYPPFRSAKYKLMSDIDLNMVDADALILSNSAFTGEFIGGERLAANSKYKVTLADGKESTNYAIANLNIDSGITNEGNHYYGLFSTVSGVVSDIDLINVTVQLNDYTDVIADTTKLVGTVCGKLEGGSIENVNVNAEIKVNENDKNTFLGKTYVGGICAYATGGKISGCTTNGTLVGGTYAPTSTAMTVDQSSYYGGIVGRVDNNDGVINCLNSLDITAPTYTTTPGSNLRQYTGGVIGGGKLNNCTNLQNDGVITVGSLNTSAFYSRPYIGGVVGRVESTSNANGVYFNNANINYYVTENNLKAYISGVLNAISLTADTYDTFDGTDLTAADVQSKLDSEAKFEFISLTNGGILNIENNVSSTDLLPSKYQAFTDITNGYDIRCAGVAYSYLTYMDVVGGYNLDAHYVRNSGEYAKVSNNAQSIDISMIDKYAPTFNADNQIAIAGNKVHLDTNYIRNNSNTVTRSVTLIKTTVTLERVYNYNDTHYITNKEVNAYMLNLSGCLNGFNMYLKNIRNDGDIKVYFTEDTHNTTKFNTYLDYFGDYRKLKVYGVFEEVSLDHRAESVYNGGNITISSSTEVTPAFTIYAGGLCHKNVGNDKDFGDSVMIPSGYKGSLHNSINAGTIRITEGDIINDDQTASGVFYGLSLIAGICTVNASTISQTFNIGDIYNINEVQIREQESSTYGAYSIGPFEVESAGFSCIQQNEKYSADGNYTRANIIDSANSGTIIAVNTNSDENAGALTNAAGFVAHNDRGEDGLLITNADSISSNAHLQKIQYSINYGDIISYNAYYGAEADGSEASWWDWFLKEVLEGIFGNFLQNTDEPLSKAAGFVCLGACSVVDVINYGNVYGTKVASGMFGFVYFSRFTSTGASSDSPIYMANAINYGEVVTLAVDGNNQNSKNLDALYNYDGKSNLTLEPEKHTKITESGGDHYPVGALIGFVDNGEMTAMKVRNLVNFNDEIDIVGRVDETRTPSNQVRIETLQYMATIKDADYSPAPFSSDRSGAANSYYIRSYYLDTTPGQPTLNEYWSKKHNGGIFNEDYTLRTAPALVDTNGNIVTDPALADPNNTDNFIADYIQFIPYSKVNDYLVKKIGLDDAVLAVALDNAIDNYDIIAKLLVYFERNGVEGKDPLDTVYAELIASYNDRLLNYKNSVVNSFSTYLKNCTEEEVREIFKVLIVDEESLAAACKATLVSDMIKVVVNEMDAEELTSLLNSIDDETKLVDILRKHPEEFAAYVELVTNTTDFTKDDSQSIFEAIKVIFSDLVYDDDAIAAYVSSLSAEDRKLLAKELYDWFSLDENMGDIIVQTYPSISINSEEDLEKLLNVVFTSSILTDGDGSYNNPYNVSQSIEAIKKLDPNTVPTESSELVYTKGKVSRIIDFSYTPDDPLTKDVIERNGYVTLEITDDKGYITAVQCRYINNTNFISQDQIKVGDFVVICGYLYNKVDDEGIVSYEYYPGCYVYTSNDNLAEGEGGDENPNNVSQSIAIGKELPENTAPTTDSELIFTKGEVLSVGAFDETNGNLTFEITDGKGYITAVQCKYINGANFTSQDQIKEGDFVVVGGYLFNHVEYSDVNNDGTEEQDVSIEYYPGCYVHSITKNYTINRTYTLNSNISEEEYRGIYAELMAYSKTEQNIIDAINELDVTSMAKLIDKFPNDINVNATIFDFFNVGRNNEETIYLPVNKYNYNAIVDSDYTYLTDINKATGTPQYTGNVADIEGNVDDSLYELLIHKKDNDGNNGYFTQEVIFSVWNISDWSGEEKISVYGYWTKDDANNFSFKANRQSVPSGDIYTIAYKNGNIVSDNPLWENTSTGVFVTSTNVSNQSVDLSFSTGSWFEYKSYSGTIDNLNFSNLFTYNYIDYGMNAVAPSKIDTDLTVGMLNALKTFVNYQKDANGNFILDDNDNKIVDSVDEQYLDIFKQYLVNFTEAAFDANTDGSLTSSIAAFAKLLFEDEFATADYNSVVVPYLLEQTDALGNETNYLTNISVSNSPAILNNITNEDVQEEIVNLFINNPDYDFSLILSNLLQFLAKNVSTKDSSSADYKYFEKMLELHIDVIKTGGPYADDSSTLANAIRTIIGSLSDSQKKELLGKISAVIGPEILKNNVDSLTKDQMILIISQQLAYDINLFNEYDNKGLNELLKLVTVTHNAGEEDEYVEHIYPKAYIAAGMIAGSDELFAEYIYSGTSIDEFQDLMEMAGLDPDTVFDFAGIYALASSKGILNGLFLPDNIEMIGMDIYEETEAGLVNDPTWRGGTVDNPNQYMNGTTYLTDTVNYKVFYEMKQLKQSIATVIFEMELVDGVMDENGEQSYEHAITNNLETDYFCNYKEYNADGSYIIKNEVYFYVPLNHDILKSDALYANMNAGCYELSYGATFDYTAKKDADTEEPNKNLYIKLAGETLFVGRTLYDEFVIQAEDTSVKTTYTVYLVITAPSYLTEINATINGGTDVTFTEDSNVVTTTNTDSTVVQNAYVTGVNGYNGNLHLIYTTKNLINGLSLLDNVKVYKTNETAFSTITSFDFAACANNSTLLELDSEYTITGGTVVIDGVTGTGYNNNFNTYDDGLVEFDIQLNNNLSKGLYLVEITLNTECVYYVLFEKAASTEANLISLTYNGQYFEKTTDVNDNQSAPTTHPFGSPVTESFFKVDGQLPNDITIDFISGTLNADYFKDTSVVCVYKKGNSNVSSPQNSNRIAIKKNPINNRYYVSGLYSDGVPQPISDIDYDYLIVVKDSSVFNILKNYEGEIAAEIETSGDNVTVTFKESMYLDSIITSPLSTFTVGNITVSQNNGLYTYAVEIIITAESGATNTFTHYITEEEYDDTLTTAYYNGAVVSINADGTYIFVDEFEKYETPTYGFDFALGAFYVGDEEFRVAYCDLNGNEITDTAVKAILEENTVVSVNQGQGFNITFKDSALSQDYYIKLVYENSVSDFFDRSTETQELTWTVDVTKTENNFGIINIKKLKNKNSYLDNVTFISESVIASIKTLVDVKEFTETTYNTMMESATREIVCLPGQIHYNKYAYDIKKQSAFYVIGIVDKTDLSFYAPEFTLPDGASVYKIVTIGGTTYKAVPYYTGTDIHTLTTFYVSEDNKTIIAPDGITTITTEATSIDTVTYNSVTYTLCPVAGKSSAEVIVMIDGNETVETVLNTTLYANYDEEGCFVEGATEGTGYFEYVDYRVYAEYYEEEQDDAYYTDYHVATQDLTNNIKFNIEIVKDSGVDDSHAEIFNAFVEFVCYTLGEGKSADKRENYELYNRAGVFGKFNQTGDDSLIASNPSLHSNTSGYYQVNVSLPEGYTYNVTLTDKRANNGDPVTTPAGDEIFIASSLTARTVSIKVTITKSTSTDNSDWGQTGTNDSFYVPSTEENE